MVMEHIRHGNRNGTVGLFGERKMSNEETMGVTNEEGTREGW